MDYYIYKIYCSDPFMKHLYIGSTNDYERRLLQHKSCSSFTNISIDHIKKLYSMIRAYGGWEHWRMEIIETIPCTDKETAEEREQYYYETFNASLNSEPPLKDKSKERYECDKCSFVAYEEENLEKHKGNCWCYDEFKTNHPMLLLEQRIKEQEKEIIKLKYPKEDVNTDDKQHNCKYCNKTLSSKSYLMKHEKTCNGLNSLQCPTCKKVFSSRFTKYEHMKNVKCEFVEIKDEKDILIEELEEVLKEKDKQLE